MLLSFLSLDMIFIHPILFLLIEHKLTSPFEYVIHRKICFSGVTTRRHGQNYVKSIRLINIYMCVCVCIYIYLNQLSKGSYCYSGHFTYKQNIELDQLTEPINMLCRSVIRKIIEVIANRIQNHILISHMKNLTEILTKQN